MIVHLLNGTLKVCYAKNNNAASVANSAAQFTVNWPWYDAIECLKDAGAVSSGYHALGSGLCMGAEFWWAPYS